MDSDTTNIREFGVTLARLIADLAVDPHGYFEKKYTARIQNAHSELEIKGVVTQLVQWVTSSAVTEQERAHLDRELGRRGLPSVSDLRLQYLP